jgi:hypothetical protein
MTDQIFYISQILEEKWQCNGTVHKLFIDFKRAYNLGGNYYAVFSLSLEYPGN